MISLEPSLGHCPKCQADRPAGLEECVQCGIIFAKYRPVTMRVKRASSTRSFDGPQWMHLIKQWCIESDTANGTLSLVGRVALYLILVWWGWRFMWTPLETNYTGESFMHLINLPFHEAGHIVFMPFGRFMMFLGGSLGQILMPVVCLVTFLIKTHDPFGASVALWWAAESIMDVAPYIDDARNLDLVLLGGVTGKETDGHDWNNILAMVDLLEWDHRLALMAHDLGVVLMLTSLAWGGWLLILHYRRLSV